MTTNQRLVTAFDAVMASAPDHPGVETAVAAVRAALATDPVAHPPVALPPLLATALHDHPTSAGPVSGLVDAIRSMVDELVWAVAYDDYDEPDMQRVRSDYRFTPFAGPDPLARHHCLDAAMFVTVQGPGVFYPQHVHKAPELYVVVGGSGEWQIGDGPFESKGPGDWIWHPTGTRHAMRTTREAMIALAIWTADTDSRPVIVRA